MSLARRPPMDVSLIALAMAGCLAVSACSAGATPSTAPVPLANAVAGMAPRAVWQHFSDLNAVPRPSHKEGKATAFVAAFGRSLGFQTTVNDVGDVIIAVPATAGMEGRPGVVLQAHLDMVAQKTSGSAFNFDTDPVKSVLDNGWVHATGTTLGADDGIGVALVMALIEAKDVPHGPIEALFTVNEEDGFSGVKALTQADLQFRTYINVDNEVEGQFLVSSAGAVNVNADGTYEQEPTPAGMAGFTLTVDGLKGGHSGADINLGRGSAHLLIGQLLDGAPASLGLRVAAIAGGTVRNAIPRTAVATVAVPVAQAAALSAYVSQFAATTAAALGAADPGLTVTVAPAAQPSLVMTSAAQAAIVGAVVAVPQGVHAMSADVPGLVETSSNLGALTIGDGKLSMIALVRSSKDAERDAQAQRVADAIAPSGAAVVLDGAYSGWPASPASKILALMKTTYASLFGSDPKVAAIHAGLETSVAGITFPGMDMISVGPTVVGVHSPDERLEVASVAKAYNLLVATLGAIK